MDQRNFDIRLPWEFALAGFLAFGAFFAAMLYTFTLIPAMETGRRFNEFAHSYCLPYLVGFAVLTPVLLLRGRRKTRAWARAAPHVPLPITAAGRTFRVSRARGMTIGVIVTAAGLLFLLLFFTLGLGANLGTRVGPGLAVLLAGLRTIYHHANRPDDADNP